MPARLRFDFVDAAGRPAPVVFASLVATVEAHRVDEVRPALREVERALARGQHAAGFVAFEAAPAFDPALVAHPPGDLPLVWFGLFDAPAPALPLDDERTATMGGTTPGEARSPVARWTSTLRPGEYTAAVEAVREAIAAGDAYQVNYTYRLAADLAGVDVPALYAALAGSQPVPYAALLDTGDWHVLSLSPELFFRLEPSGGGTRIVMRPMKGTAPRGLWPADDDARAAALAASEKNRAENVMIVDLVRNDLSRVCDVGSVRATDLFQVQRFPTVLQMISTVGGRVSPGVTLTDVFGAIFPSGSVTGAPKTSSLRLIRAIEPTPRGVYCGTIGYASPDGRAVFNVAIRTAMVRAATGRAVFGVGGGITWDSTPGDEYAEAESKSACLHPAPVFALIETLRAEDGRPIRAGAHVARLAASATHLGFACDASRALAALEDEAHARGAGRWRLRLTLDRTGRVNVTSHPAAAAPPDPATCVWSPLPVEATDPFLYVKTTRRDVYDRHLAAGLAAATAGTGADAGADPGASAAGEVFDVLLWNAAGEATEFTRGNLVVGDDGGMWTPPVSSGLLAGVFRGELIARGLVRERVVTVDDLARAPRLWFVNSLREWVPVRLAGDHPRRCSTNSSST
ncbi:MAG: aminodeoxychorismate synthase component I [Vicinamibacterales bacterium]